MLLFRILFCLNDVYRKVNKMFVVTGTVFDEDDEMRDVRTHCAIFDTFEDAREGLRLSKEYYAKLGSFCQLEVRETCIWRVEDYAETLEVE